MKNLFFKSGKLFIFAIFAIFTLSIFTSSVVHGDKSSAITAYKQVLQDMGYPGNIADEAKEQVENFIGVMDAAKEAVNTKYEQLKSAVYAMNPNDSRKGNVEKLLKIADDSKGAFKDLDSADHVTVSTPTGSIAPKLMPDDEFIAAEKKATDDINTVNRTMIAPAKPGNVPEGDIMEDFIPQVIRQLFRFAWLAVLISLVTSGVFFVIAFDNDERLNKAKRMIYYSLIGFAFVTLAFALVKAVTDIDFFNFI
jgi:hypothetical protein